MGKSMAATKTKGAGAKVMEGPFSYIQMAMIIFIILVFAAVMYFSFGRPSITGDVTMTQGEFNIITPIGFSFSMLIVGAIAVTFTIFALMKEGAGKQ